MPRFNLNLFLIPRTQSQQAACISVPSLETIFRGQRTTGKWIPFRPSSIFVGEPLVIWARRKVTFLLATLEPLWRGGAWGRSAGKISHLKFYYFVNMDFNVITVSREEKWSTARAVSPLRMSVFMDHWGKRTVVYTKHFFLLHLKLYLNSAACWLSCRREGGEWIVFLWNEYTFEWRFSIVDSIKEE